MYIKLITTASEVGRGVRYYQMTSSLDSNQIIFSTNI